MLAGVSTRRYQRLGLWDGSTENPALATALLSDSVERGLDPEQGILFVIDGAKALHKAIHSVFGDARCRDACGTRNATCSTCWVAGGSFAPRLPRIRA